MSFKRRADHALEEILRAVFEEIDTDRVRAEVIELRAASTSFEPLGHSRTLARRAAIRCAAAGAVTGLPFGNLAIGTLGIDLAYLVYQQFRLVLGIATIYGHEPTGRERFNEALSCLAYASGVGVGKGGLATVLGSGLLAEKIGTRIVRDRLAKIIPVIGAISGGAINFLSVRAVANAAIRTYEARIDPQLADEIWDEGDREHA